MYVAFSTTNYAYLLGEIVGRRVEAPIMSGGLERKVFADGEIYHKFNLSDIEDKDVIIIGGTYTAEETLELYDLGCSAVKHGAKSLTLFIPYFGYSTMERALKPGEIVKAKTRARLLSTIPSGARPNRIVFLDLHTEGLPHYLEGNVQPIHMYAKDLVIEACREIAGDDFVLGSTDAGRAKWIESLAKDMKVNCAIITKRRISGSETEVTSVNADVKDRIVIIYDDMIRTGGSVIGAAEKYLEAGAKEVHVVATHGVLPGNSVAKMADSGKVKTITVTDSHPRAREVMAEICKYVEMDVPIAGFVVYKDCGFKVKHIADHVRQRLCVSKYSM